MKVNEWLLDVAAGRRNRVIITLPPQNGKSTLISQTFPAWFVGRFPTRNIVLASYEAGFAAEWGMRSRDILTEWGPSVFGVRMSDEVTARDNWRVELFDEGWQEWRLAGGMNTGGAGGPLTGRTADVLLIDDPIKNPEEANSEVARQHLWNWFQSVAMARLSHPDAPVILVMTRWHQDDLVGRIIAQSHTDPGAEQWDVLRLPAIADDEEDALGRDIGDPLWPEVWPLDALRRRKGGMSEYWWQAQYQGRPTPRGGGMFKQDMFNIIERPPEGVEWIRFWDLASTEKSARAADPDYTVGAKVGLKDGRMIIADVKRGQLSPAGVEGILQRTASQDGRGIPIFIEQEGGASGKLTQSHISRNVLAGYRARFRRPSGSKVDRADTVASYAENGNLDIVRAAWNQPLIDEFLTFPQGAHDDQVDATSGALNELVGKPRFRGH